MNAIELHTPDGKSTKVWMCSACSKLYNRSYQPIGDGKGRSYTPEERDEFGRQEAERCCTEATCEHCGADLGRTWDKGGWSICETCRSKRDAEEEAARFTKAEKVLACDWDGEGMLYDAACDQWFRDLDEAEEWYADDEERTRPAYLYLSTPAQWEPNVRDHIESGMHDNIHSEASDYIHDEQWKRLEAFVRGWWDEVKPTFYDVDFGRCLLLDGK